jgi:hypothetical protein
MLTIAIEALRDGNSVASDGLRDVSSLVPVFASVLELLSSCTMLYSTAMCTYDASVQHNKCQHCASVKLETH